MSDRNLSKPAEGIKKHTWWKDFQGYGTLLWSTYHKIMRFSMAMFTLLMKLRSGIPVFHSCCSWSVTTAHSFAFPSGVFMYKVFFFRVELLQLKEGTHKNLWSSFTFCRDTNWFQQQGCLSKCCWRRTGPSESRQGRYCPRMSPEQLHWLFFPAEVLQGPVSNLTYLLPLPTVDIPKEVRADLCVLEQPVLGAVLLRGAAVTLQWNSPAALFHSLYWPCVVYVPFNLSCLISFTA